MRFFLSFKEEKCLSGLAASLHLESFRPLLLGTTFLIWIKICNTTQLSHHRPRGAHRFASPYCSTGHLNERASCQCCFASCFGIYCRILLLQSTLIDITWPLDSWAWCLYRSGSLQHPNSGPLCALQERGVHGPLHSLRLCTAPVEERGYTLHGLRNRIRPDFIHK